MLRLTDLYHLHSNSNPLWRISEEIEEQIRVTYTTIRIHEFGVLKNKPRRFKSSSYEFESFIKLKLKAEGWQSDSNFWVTNSNHSFAKFKYYKGDSNYLHSDSNSSFCKSIKCSTYSRSNLIKALQRSLMLNQIYMLQKIFEDTRITL